MCVKVKKNNFKNIYHITTKSAIIKQYSRRKAKPLIYEKLSQKSYQWRKQCKEVGNYLLVDTPHMYDWRFYRQRIFQARHTAESADSRKSCAYVFVGSLYDVSGNEMAALCAVVHTGLHGVRVFPCLVRRRVS